MTQKRHTRRTRHKRQKGGLFGLSWGKNNNERENNDNQSYNNNGMENNENQQYNGRENNESGKSYSSWWPFHSSRSNSSSNTRYQERGGSLTDDTEPSYTLTTSTGGRCGKCGGMIRQKGGFSSHTNLANNAASFSGKTVGGRKRKSMKFCRRHHHLHCKSCKN